MKDYNPELSRCLRQARIRAGFTQAELAQKLGYTSPQFVSNWERGVARPPLSKTKELIELLKMSKKTYIQVLLKDEKQNLIRELKRKS